MSSFIRLGMSSRSIHQHSILRHTTPRQPFSLGHTTRRAIKSLPPQLPSSHRFRPRASSSPSEADQPTTTTQPSDTLPTTTSSSSESSSSDNNQTPSRSNNNNNKDDNNTTDNTDTPFWRIILPSSSNKKPSSSSPNKHNNNNNSSPFKPKYILRLVINILAFFLLLRFMPSPSAMHSPVAAPEGVVLRVAYSDFLKAVRRNEISRVVVNSDGGVISYALRQNADLFKNAPKGLESAKFSFETVRPVDFPMPYETLMANNVPFSAMEKRGGFFSSILGYGLLLFVVIGILNRLPNFKLPYRGTARRHSSSSISPDQNRITFDDVAGVDEAKEELQEIVEYLRDPEKFAKLGARPPGGVLLVGPPGTGKTLLARAVAGEANVPFFSISASEFVELYVGMGALRVRELFSMARKESPSIVFIDEIDAIGKGRDGRLRSVGNDEREQTLNQLLTELDGFEMGSKDIGTSSSSFMSGNNNGNNNNGNSSGVVICLAATNRPDVLDAALLRPGRFDRRVPVERPDKIGRESILQTHIVRKGLPLDSDVNVAALALQTAGFTGADLANVVNEAALLAGRRSHDCVTAEDFDAAILRAIAGLEKKRSVLHGEEKKVVARHEAGHALVASAVRSLVDSFNEVERLSIIPRTGGALGFTYSPPSSEDRVLLFENEIRGQLATLMGGRAAEVLTSTSVSTGAVDDIKRATDLAHRAVAEYGLSAAVGPLNVAALSMAGEEYSLLMDGGGDVGKNVEKEVQQLCSSALNVAKEVITANKQLHEKLSEVLEAEERLEGEMLKEWLRGVVVPRRLEEFIVRGKMVVG